ncbi:MAG TPA: hypothetical protein VD815_01360 [Candidatus Saccharimonadales bacterium]|nr:hypothetical protein [Candidatus Saccharimonadales bacterium]
MELNKIKHQEVQIENPFYCSMINKIKKWLDEAHNLSYREEDNPHPDLYYKLWVFFNDGRTISISLDYFKNYLIQDCLVIGWLWRLDNIDKEALDNIQNTRVKQQFIESLKAIYKEKSFKITAKFNGKYFNNISISKDLQLENLTERCFFECPLDLSFAWEFVKNNFDFRNIQRNKLILR